MRRRDEQGAAALEFGLIMPILLLLVFGIIQYGLYFWAMQGGSDIARDFARRVAVSESDVNECSAFKSVVHDAIDDFAGAEGVRLIRRTYIQDTTLTRTASSPVVVGDRVEVEVQFTSHDLNLPFIPFINDGLVTSTVEARVENVDTASPPVSPAAMPAGLECEETVTP